MFLTVDPHSGVPVYRQIMDQIRFLVASGQLAVGEEIPSTRSLSAELGVNPMTISKAYGFLEKEGLLERRRGQPLVVRERPGEELQAGKIDQLREALTPAARLSRRLGIGGETALATFRDLLTDMDNKEY